MVDYNRPEERMPLYHSKNDYRHTNIDKIRRLTGLYNYDEDNFEESKASIGDALYDLHEEERGRKVRTHSFALNFRNFMEEKQNEGMKYSYQAKNTAPTQGQ